MKSTALLLLLALAAGAGDAPAPKVTGRLCQGFEGQVVAMGITDRFPSDSKVVCLVFECEEPPAAGAAFHTRIVAGDGTPLVEEDGPLPCDGTAKAFGIGYFLSGRAWARNGGKFRFQLRFGAAEAPLLDLPFEVVPGNRFALLVGIKDYPPKGPENDLPGCDADVARIANLLTAAFGVPEDHIAKLLDLDATREAIERELRALAERAQPGDAAIFYYSGHGTQVPDLDGDEEDGWDEGIVPADPKPALFTTEEQLRLFLTDDRIAELLRLFRTRNVTVIFDSCHSGTAVREAEAVPPPPGLFSAKTKEFAFGRALRDRAEEARAGGRVGDRPDWDADKGYVFLAACRPWETSGCNEQVGGFFSFRLVPFLAMSQGESWDRLLARIAPTVTGINSAQSPGVEGATRRFPFSLAESGEEAPFVRPTLAVAGAVESSKATVPGSPIAALAEGSAGTHRALVSGLASIYEEQGGCLYDVYPAGETAFTGEPKARVKVTGESVMHQDAPVSTAEIEKGSVSSGDRLVPRTVRIPAAQPRVAPTVNDPGDPQAAARLVEAMKAIDGAFAGESRVRFVKEGRWTDFDYVVEPRILNGKLALLVWTGGGQLAGIFEGEAAALAGKARDFVVERHDRFARILRLSNPSPPFRLTASVPGGEAPRAAGERVRVEAAAGAAAFLTILAATDGGDLRVVAASGAALEPGGILAGDFEVPPEAAAAGRVALRVLATERPLDLASFSKASAGARAEALFAAMRTTLGSGDERFLPTDGWADTTAWVAVRRK